MATPQHDYQLLMSQALNPDDIATVAFAGVISMRATRQKPYDTPIAGLNDYSILSIKRCFFPGAPIESITPLPLAQCHELEDEFGDLLELLMEHRTVPDETSTWLSHAIATASMSSNHLWQDMGLPSRAMLSQLMRRYFTSLAGRNTGDMKWKKFFYRELCERAGLSVCRSPSCGVCSDYSNCFGPEEATSGHLLITA